MAGSLNRADTILRTAGRIRFRDWTLHVSVDAETITWIYPCIDPDTGQALLLKGRPWALWHIPDERLEREVVTSALAAALLVSEHEVREEFRLGDERPFNPHARPLPGVPATKTGEQ